MKKIKVYFLKFFEMFKWFVNTFNLRKDCEISNKLVVFSELCTSLTSIKVNCLLAISLREEFDIMVIFPKYSPFYEFFYKMIGIKKFIYLNQSLSNKEISNVDKIWGVLKSKKNILNYSYESIRVGKFIGSKILRENEIGKFDFDKIDNAQIKMYLYDSIAKIENFKRIIKKIKINFLIFNERGYTPSGEIFEVALKNNIKCIQWFGSPIDKYHSLKCYNWRMREHHPLKLKKNTIRKLLKADLNKSISSQVITHLKDQYIRKKGFNRQNLQKNTIIYNKTQFKKKLNLYNNKKICAVFTHIFDDATFFYGKSLFTSYEEWLKNVLLIAKKITNVNWIIKIHPANIFRDNISLEEKLINRVFKKLPQNIKIVKPNTDINTFSFFKSIDYALTVRGTVGCELACYGIPVITAGTGRYSDEGFTIDPKTKREFFNLLINLKKIKKMNSRQVQLARVYTYGSLIARSIKMDGINIDYNFKELSLEKSSLINIPKNYDDLKKKSDVRKILKWVVQGATEDLLEY